MPPLEIADAGVEGVRMTEESIQDKRQDSSHGTMLKAEDKVFFEHAR